MGLLMHTVPEVRVRGVFIHLPPGELRLGAMRCALLVCLRSQSWRGWTGKFPRGSWPGRCEGGVSPSSFKHVGFAFCRSPVRGAGARPRGSGRLCLGSRPWQRRCESGVALHCSSRGGFAFGPTPARGRGWTGKCPRGGISPSAVKQVGFAFCRSPVRGAGACPGLAARTCSRSRRWQWWCESGTARASVSWSGSAFGRSPARGAGACPQGWEPWPRSRPCRCESRGLRPSLKRVGRPCLRSPAGARSGASFGPRTGRQGQASEECQVEEENEHCEETNPSSGLSIGNECRSAAGSPGQGVQRKWWCSHPR